MERPNPMGHGWFRATAGASLVLAGALAGCAVPAPHVPRVGPQAARDYTAALARGPSPRPVAGLPPIDEGSSLADCLTYAALNNPGLRAAFEQWRAALARVPQARALPEPQLTYTYYIREVETRVGPQQQGLALRQKFPWFGKLRLRGEAAGQEAEAAWQRFQARKLALFHRVKSAFAELYHLRRAVAVTRDSLTLLARLEGVARAKYRAGIASHSDVTRAQVELGKLDDRLRTLQELRGPHAARLNAALGRPAGAEAPWPQDAPEAAPRLPEQQLAGWLKASNPDLLALEAEVRKDEAGLALAHRQYYPDVALGVGFVDTAGARMPGTDESGKDPVLLTLSVDLPLWWGKYSAAEDEARASIRRARGALAERTHVLGAELKLAVYQMEDARRRTALYTDTLIPKAQESLNATETAFRAGAADFLSLLDSQRQLLEFELARARARADHLTAASRLEMLLGRELPEDRPQQPPPREREGANAKGTS